MKVSTAASAAVKAALLAKSGIRVSSEQGIVAETVGQSIENLGSLSREGMVETDRQIVSIMLAKQEPRIQG
jgi:L-cysteine desulfidase